MEIVKKPLFFSFEKILKHCKYDPYKTKNTLISYFRRPTTKFDGYSFILNPEPLYTLVGNDIEVLDYIGILAQRNYFDYKYLGRRGLFIDLCSIPVEKLKTNRLLKIGEDYINFIYEDHYGN